MCSAHICGESYSSDIYCIEVLRHVKGLVIFNVMHIAPGSPATTALAMGACCASAPSAKVAFPFAYITFLAICRALFGWMFTTAVSTLLLGISALASALALLSASMTTSTTSAVVSLGVVLVYSVHFTCLWFVYVLEEHLA